MVAVFCLLSPATALAIDDAHVVYCLAPKQRDALQEAAVALGKAENRSAIGDVAAWRKRDATAFEDTCEALYESVKPQPGVFADLLPFLTAVAAALLTYFAALATERRNRRRQQAAALRAALTEFDAAARHYTHELAGNRPVERLRLAHGVLAGKVAEAAAENPGWTTAAACHTRLVSGDLGMDALTAGWEGDKEARAREVRRQVSILQTALQRVAAGLARPRVRNPDKDEDDKAPTAIPSTGNAP
ncbi:hypothetical protein ACTG9Q_07080 [Actinokineospora sp. 24-640]